MDAGKSGVAGNAPGSPVDDVLRHSEEWQQALVETLDKAGYGIVVLQDTPDREAAIVFVNEVACRMVGVSPAEALTLSAWEAFEPSERTMLRDRYKQRQNGEQAPGHYETTMRRKDGTFLIAEVSVSTMSYRGNVATMLFLKDISEQKQMRQELDTHRRHLEELVAERTAELRQANERLEHEIAERKQAEEKLRSRERYLRSVIQNSLDAVMIVGAQGKITYVTPYIESASGYKPEEIVGLSVLSQIHPDDLPIARNIYEELLKDIGASVRAEVRVRHKDGSWHTVETIARNFADDPMVSGIIINYIDVTEHRRAAEELQELYSQEKDLREQMELEMKMRVEFARTLAHELKTPLTPLLISSQVLASQLKEEPLLSLARNIMRGASNLNGRVNDLLDLASGTVGMLKLRDEFLDLCQLLREVAEYVSPVAVSRKQSFVVDLPDTLPLVRADKDRLYQIVLNLLNNALKFTPEGGRIALRAGQKDASLVVEVEDNGPGIAEEEQRQLFEPYHRIVVTERLSGLGLGLAICKKLVELHGGRIWLKSNAGEGSTFSFSLPLEAAEQ